MAVPVHYMAIKPSLCAVYSQNWQIPNPATSITHRNFFHRSGVFIFSCAVVVCVV